MNQSQYNHYLLNRDPRYTAAQATNQSSGQAFHGHFPGGRRVVRPLMLLYALMGLGASLGLLARHLLWS